MKVILFLIGLIFISHSEGLRVNNSSNSSENSTEHHIQESFNLAWSVDQVSFQKAILDIHNYYRAKHGSSALVQHPKLTSIAQRYADYLASSGQFDHSSNGYGENLSGGYSCSSIKDIAQKVVRNWYNEGVESKYNYAAGQPDGDGDYLHFTQVVWASTRYLGCGIATSTSGGCTSYTVVCNYSPAGNMGGEFIDNVKPLIN